MAWWSELVSEPYPPPLIFDTDRKITISELRRFASIILTEGIPRAFSTHPMAFEFARQRAAEQLSVHAKQISLTGSARIGYSLSPKTFGRAFDAAISDVDLFLISHERFGEIAGEYAAFLDDWKRGEVNPRHDKEAVYWTAAKDFCPYNIKQGFLDAKYVPTFNRYPTSRRFAEASFKFLVNANSLAGSEVVKAASIRAYRDWGSAIGNISENLKRALEKKREPGAPPAH